MSGQAFALAALSLKGVPFKHQGRSLWGVDCVGLLVVSANSVGLDLSEVDDAHYPEATDGRLLAERLEACAVKMPDGTPPAIGDVLLFKVAGVATHVGVATGAGRMVHAYRAVGKVVEHDLGAKWSRRLVGVYRLGATE